MMIIKLRLDELTPDPENAKAHPAKQIEQIKKSIRRAKHGKERGDNVQKSE